MDRIISGEIPDPDEDLELYNLVKSCMIHGPCGVLNPNSVCINARRNFKPFRDETLENVNGYPEYRRRDNDRTVQVGNIVADNRLAVPYNKYQSIKLTSTMRHVQCQVPI